MKILCSREELQKGVGIVSKAVPTRTTMAILECILIDASKNEIKLMANDTELGIETIIEGNIEERGIIALDAKIFSEIVRKLPEGEVSITTEDNFKTKIVCGNAKFDIIGKSGEDFSYIPVIPRNEPLNISMITLRDVIRQTIFSIAPNENNKILTGELFEINGNSLRVVSLDGHRVSMRVVELKEAYPENKKIVVPGKTLSDVSKIIQGDSEDEVSIYITSNHIIFEFAKTTVVSRLLDGEFLSIEQMLSKDYSSKIKINRVQLLECIDRASLMANEGDKKPILIDIKDNNLELKISSFIGSMNEKIDIVKEGKDITIAFNPKFLIDALKVIDDEEVSIYMINPKAPCYIRNDQESYLYLILPINYN